MQGKLLLLERGGLLISFATFFLIFSIIDSSFLTKANLLDLIDQNATVAIASIGLLVVVISGGLDLSMGSIAALSGVALATFYKNGMNPLLAMAAAIFLCFMIGAIQGTLVHSVGVNTVIVSLAGMIWARGLATAITNGNSIIINSNLTRVVTVRHIGYISQLTIIILLSFLLVDFLLRKTKFGRYVFAIGGNQQAARQAGLPVLRVGIAVFALSGAFSGLAGGLEAGRLGAAGPTQNLNLILDALVAVILGGARLSGGEGAVSRTFLGVIFVATMNNGLSLLGFSDAYVYLYKGLIVLLALSLEVLARRLARGKSQT